MDRLAELIAEVSHRNQTEYAAAHMHAMDRVACLSGLPLVMFPESQINGCGS